MNEQIVQKILDKLPTLSTHDVSALMSQYQNTEGVWTLLIILVIFGMSALILKIVCDRIK